MDIKESTSDLQKYYKKVLTCRVCGKSFGSDLKKNSKFCSLCERKLRRENE